MFMQNKLLLICQRISELDPNNFFYTGFSYGGHAALMLMNNLEFGDNNK